MLTALTPVTLSDGTLRKANLLRPGEKILCGNGLSLKITDVIVSRYSGNLVFINGMGPFTEEHMVHTKYGLRYVGTLDSIDKVYGLSKVSLCSTIVDWLIGKNTLSLNSKLQRVRSVEKTEVSSYPVYHIKFAGGNNTFVAGGFVTSNY